MDGLSRGRNVFGTPSSWVALDEDLNEERDQILADAVALKAAAVMYQHPEFEVQVDTAAAFARNYFSQPWASEQETFGAAEARIQAVAQTKAFKDLATLYQHPEAPLEVSGSSSGRNYYSRASAEEQTDRYSDRKRTQILEDAAALKHTATMFLHPEAPVETDSMAFGRNYYSRASGVDQEEDELSDEREIILEEMKELKQLAVDYQHPEMPLVGMDAATAFGRNYYGRASAEAGEAMATANERDLVLKEAAQLKQLALDYLHPEAPLVVADATIFGRNYYGRASADDQVDMEEQERIIAECAQLKQLAVDYLHPELPITAATTDAAVFGRNFYGRPSADDQDSEQDERDLIMQELSTLKENAVMYRHPEMPLGDVDPSVFGRNYFNRASAIDKETFGAAEERARIIAEAAELKKMATVYLHPEVPVETVPTTFGRNYYSRPSAEDSSDSRYERERARALEDAANLKRLAVDFMHPEKSLVIDPTCYGRNYFGRASAEEREDDEYSDDREIILEEMAELKQVALDFMHPERPVVMDSSLSCRNYFGRASAPEQESYGESEERVRVLVEASSLKKLAVDYAHPELPLAPTDGTASGRSFFSRPSAPGDSYEEAEARDQVLEDAARLKKLAIDYLHPERAVDVSSTTACARNFFSRASAPDQVSFEEGHERTAILEDASTLKKLAVDYLHPEIPVKTADPAACGRNYFARSSALGVSELIASSGHVNHPTEDYAHAEEHSHHDDYGHFDMDEDLFYDMRQTIVLPGESHVPSAPKVQSSKISSDEEGELSRSPSSIMLFTGNFEDADHPALPSMG